MHYFHVRFWGTQYPRVIHQCELHPIKVAVWRGVTPERVIGPYYFEDDEDGNTVTVTGDRYREMVLFEMFRKLCASCPNVHTARATVQRSKQAEQTRKIKM